MLGDGEHTEVAVVDGVELGRPTVTVARWAKSLCATWRVHVCWPTFRRRVDVSLTWQDSLSELSHYGRGVRAAATRTETWSPDRRLAADGASTVYGTVQLLDGAIGHPTQRGLPLSC